MSKPVVPQVDTELLRLEVLRAYKQHFDRDSNRNVSPFEEDQIVRYGTDVRACDVPEIHGNVRAKIAETVAGIHAGQGSKVVILTGDPGMGKSHILNYFRDRDKADELRYIHVSNDNHWKSNEFESYLLDRMLASLLHPSPNEPHLLREKIEDVAFQALGQILAQPGRIAKFQIGRSGNWAQRLWSKLTRHDVQSIQRQASERDRKVFRSLDFDKFSGFVCDRFLHEPGHVFHRYVLRVLLRYLFIDDHEQVLHWLRREHAAGHDSFFKKVGAEERIDKNYKVIDTIKILISLFADDVAAGLSVGTEKKSKARVFFFVFDQMEGRNELFDSEKDWFTFFAQLSELYNALPNVFILFTMTLGQRSKLHGRMEAQFKDRIRGDKHFILHEIEDREILTLYRRRVDHWLGENAADTRAKLEQGGETYLPFDQTQVLEMTRNQHTLRRTLEVLDEQFKKAMIDLCVESSLDYRVIRKEFRAAQETAANDFKYTATHLIALKELIDRIGPILAAAEGLVCKQALIRDTSAEPSLLEFYFVDASNPALWVRVFFSRLTYNCSRKAKASLDLLKHRQRNKNLLHLIRARPYDMVVPEHNLRQVSFSASLAEVHTTMQALLRMLERRTAYKADEWAKFEVFLLDALRKTYLGDLLRAVNSALEDQRLQATEDDEPGILAEPLDVEAAPASIVISRQSSLFEAEESTP